MLCRVSATISLTVCDVPAGAQLRHELPHLLHLVVVGAADEVDELGVRRAQHRAAGDQAAGLERRLNASVLDLAMIVLSRSKNAAVGRGAAAHVLQS